MALLRIPDKVGHVILGNNIASGSTGKMYPVNINANGTIMGHTAYKSVLELKGKVDLAVIAVPAEIVPEVVEECGKAGVKGVIVVSGGFSEIGRTDLQDKVTKSALKYAMPIIGPNCLGVPGLIFEGRHPVPAGSEDRQAGSWGSQLRLPERGRGQLGAGHDRLARASGWPASYPTAMPQSLTRLTY